MADGIMTVINGGNISSTEKRIPKNTTIKLRPAGKVASRHAKRQYV